MQHSFPISEGTRNCIDAKKRVWLAFKRTGLLALKSDHHRLAKLCKKLVYKDKISFEDKLSDNKDNKKFLIT